MYLFGEWGLLTGGPSEWGGGKCIGLVGGNY